MDIYIVHGILESLTSTLLHPIILKVIYPLALGKSVFHNFNPN